MNAAMLDRIDRAITALPRSRDGNCLAMTLIGNEAKWVQYVVGGTINAAYPFAAPPAAMLPAFALAVPLRGWQAGAYAAFDLGPARVAAAVSFIDRYFEYVLGCGPDYQLGFEVVEI